MASKYMYILINAFWKDEDEEQLQPLVTKGMFIYCQRGVGQNLGVYENYLEFYYNALKNKFTGRNF